MHQNCTSLMKGSVVVAAGFSGRADLRAAAEVVVTVWLEAGLEAVVCRSREHNLSASD